jgi:hypothetical protein
VRELYDIIGHKQRHVKRDENKMKGTVPGGKKQRPDEDPTTNFPTMLLPDTKRRPRKEKSFKAAVVKLLACHGSDHRRLVQAVAQFYGKSCFGDWGHFLMHCFIKTERS